MLGDVNEAIRPFAIALLALALWSPSVLAQGAFEPLPRRPVDPYEAALRELLEFPAGRAFLEAYIAVQRDYLYHVDREALLEGATAGLIESLGDPFSRYVGAEDAEAARRAGAGSTVEVAQVGDIGVIRIATFESDVVGARFSSALDALLAGGARGVVLDLRGNAGGSILQGLQVLDRFLAEGELGFRRVRGVSVPIAYANPRAIAHPLIVLVDADTASTSEIVAGTLQAYGRGRIIGATTAGKGVGQTAVRLADGAELRLVSFEWLLPGLRSIDGVGLTPDLLVSAEPADPVTDGGTRPLVSVADEGGDPALRLALDALRGLLSDELEVRTRIPVPAVAASPVAEPDPDDAPIVEEPRPDERPEISDENQEALPPVVKPRP
jgi:C-terminal processing protease CtpA/Prc